MLGRGVLRRKATVLTAVILCLLLTIGLNIVEIPRGEAQADVLRVGATTTADLDALDPHIRTGREIAIMENFMEPLVAYDGETTNFRPMLAQNWNVSPDGTVWTFRLRRNVKFHDGTVFKADAVQYALDRINGIKQSPAYPLLQNKVKSFKVLDDYTVQFTVNKGGASVLDLMTMVLMVSPAAGKAHDNSDLAQAYFRSHPIGTGPYKLDSWDKGSKMVLAKFPDYWGGWQSNQYTEVIDQIIPDPSTQQLMLQRGDLDIAGYFPVGSLPALRRDPNIVVQETTGFRIKLMRMNNVAGLTKDARVRKALALAFDYDGYVKTENGVVGPPTGPIPAAMMKGWIPDNLPKFDLAQAKALLTAAQVPQGTSFHVFVAKGDDAQLNAAQVLQASLAKIGYDLKIDVQEFSDWSQAIVNWVEKDSSNPAKSPSDMFNLVVPPRIPNAWAYLWFNYDSGAVRGAGRNWYQYQVPAVDNLIDAASAQTDPAKALDMFKQAARRIVEDQPDIFYGNEQRISVRRASVKNYQFHPAWFPEMHFYPLRHG